MLTAVAVAAHQQRAVPMAGLVRGTVSVQLPTDDPEASPNPARSAPNRRVILSVQTRRFRRWPLLNLAVTVC